MIPKDTAARLRDNLLWYWRNSLMYGPIAYDPPDPDRCKKLGFTHEEGIVFYDECLKKSGMTEISLGFWDYKK